VIGDFNVTFFQRDLARLNQWCQDLGIMIDLEFTAKTGIIIFKDIKRMGIEGNDFFNAKIPE